jgi:hypothetical protein
MNNFVHFLNDSVQPNLLTTVDCDAPTAAVNLPPRSHFLLYFIDPLGVNLLADQASAARLGRREFMKGRLGEI